LLGFSTRRRSFFLRLEFLSLSTAAPRRTIRTGLMIFTTGDHEDVRSDINRFRHGCLLFLVRPKVNWSSGLEIYAKIFGLNSILGVPTPRYASARADLVQAPRTVVSVFSDGPHLQSCPQRLEWRNIRILGWSCISHINSHFTSPHVVLRIVPAPSLLSIGPEM
jgi:hypothetical protein